MSGSSKKKLRKEQREAVLTEKQLQEKKEAKQLKTYTWTFVIAMVLVVAIVAGIFLQNPINSLINQNTHAVTIGNHKLTIPEFSYFFVDEINNYYMTLYNSYGSYTPYLLGFQTGVSLNKQVYDQTTGETWAEFFMESAAESAQTVYGLYDLAQKAGHTLSEDELANLDAAMSEMDYTATKSGYHSTNDYLAALYGNGATRDTYLKYSTVSALASSFYNKYSEDLHDSYTDEDFRKYEADKIGEFYSYTYLSHTINVKDYLGEQKKDESGNKIPYTDEEMAEAMAKAKADVEKLLGSNITDAASFNLVLSEMFKEAQKEANKDTASEPTDSTDPSAEPSTEATVEPSSEVTTEPTMESTTATTGGTSSTEPTAPTCTEGDRQLYSKLNTTLQEWVKSENLVLNVLTSLEVKTEKEHTHEEGEEHSDDEEKEYEVTGFIVVLMQKVDHNDMKMVNVRHILIELEKLADTASDKEKEAADLAAREKAEKLLNEFLAGDKTPESFGVLAEANTKDTGSVTTGGLYEDVYPGWAVKEFDEWCFAEDRKVGDTGIVKTEHGYHVMYLESFTDLSFRDYMIANSILSEDLEAWLKDIKTATPYVEVDLSRMFWDITLG